MSSITSSCRASLTGSRTTIASASTLSTRKSNCLRELVHLRRLSHSNKMTRRRIKLGVMCNGVNLTRVDSPLSQRTSVGHLPIGSSKLLVARLVELGEAVAEVHGLVSSVERRLTWQRTAPIPTRPREGSMAAAEVETAAVTSQQGEAAEIRR